MICRPVAVVAFTLACGVVVGTAAEPITGKVVSVSDRDTIDATKRLVCAGYVCRLRVARPAMQGIC